MITCERDVRGAVVAAEWRHMTELVESLFVRPVEEVCLHVGAAWMAVVDDRV